MPSHATPRLCALAALTAALAFALCACTARSGSPSSAAGTATVSHEPDHATSVTAPPAMTPPPLFTTEEEALAAAEDAYAAYLKVVDAIGRDGGAGIDRMRSVTAGEMREVEMEGLTKYSHDGTRTTGKTVFDSVRIESWRADESRVSIYVCEDISTVDVIDSQGRSVVGEGREDRLPFIAEFEAESGHLLLMRRRVWSGKNFCD